MPSKKTIFSFPRNIFFLGLVSFFTDVSSEMIYPLLPLFLISTLGVGTTFVGLVEGIAESTASLFKLFSGWLSDRLGRRKSLVVLGYSLSTFARPLVALATAGWHVLLVRFFDRVGKGVRTSPRDALVADASMKGEEGKAFGFQRAMDHAGAVIGPLIAFFLLTFLTTQYRLIFWLAFIPGIAALFTLVIGVRERPAGGIEDTPPRIFSGWRSFPRRFKSFLFVLVLFTLGNSSDAFLILRARDAGVSVALIPILWIALHISKTASSIPGGMLSDRWGRKPVIIAGWVLYSAVYWGFSGAGTSAEIWALFLIYGFYYGLTEGAERALVADLVPPGQRGTAYGLYNFAIGVSTFPASLLMGFLWERWNPSVAFGFGATLSLASAILLGIMLKTNKKGEEGKG